MTDVERAAPRDRDGAGERGQGASDGTDAGALVGRHRVRRVERRAEPTGWEQDDVVTEYPLTLVVNGTEMATLVCSPSHLEELVLGFLTAEGVLRPDEPLDRLFVDREEGMAFVEAPEREGALEQQMFGKRYVGSCCGKSRTGFYFANDARTARPVVTDLTVTAEDCFRLMEQLQASSPVFARTGGVHNAGLGTSSGLEVVRTDIGRHNTLDKLYGHALREGTELGRRVVPFSGRVSSEVLLKLAKMGCPVLVSKSAPTLLALEMAGDLGVTVVGFARSDRFNLYTHPGRIRGAASLDRGTRRSGAA